MLDSCPSSHVVAISTSPLLKVRPCWLFQSGKRLSASVPVLRSNRTHPKPGPVLFRLSAHVPQLSHSIQVSTLFVPVVRGCLPHQLGSRCNYAWNRYLSHFSCRSRHVAHLFNEQARYCQGGSCCHACLIQRLLSRPTCLVVGVGSKTGLAAVSTSFRPSRNHFLLPHLTSINPASHYN